MRKTGFLKSLIYGLVFLLGFILLTLLAMTVFLFISDTTNGSMISDGEQRKYLLYVPESYDPARAAPLVVTIHGYAEWPAHVRNVTHWNTLADQYGFIVVYPSGTKFPKRWATFNEQSPSDGQTKDILFISDLIEKLESEYNIDSQRVYVNGFSNGGGMSLLVGCQLSDRVAAIGGVAGAYLFPLDNCSPSRPVPMIAFHGTDDPIVPYAGGPSRSFDIPFANIPDWIEVRARLNGCDTNPEVSRVIEGVTQTRYSSCNQAADVVLYTLEGQGHDWAGGKTLPRWLVGEHSDAIDTTKLIWEFFQDHPLP